LPTDRNRTYRTCTTFTRQYSADHPNLPLSSFAAGAGPDGTNEESTPAITKDTDPITSSGNSSSPGLPEVGADDFGNINGLLSGLSGLQANAGTSNGDDKDTNAALGSLTGTAAQPTGESQDATAQSDSATPVGLVAAVMTSSAISGACSTATFASLPH
jgi:hypothetical protein